MKSVFTPGVVVIVAAEGQAVDMPAVAMSLMVRPNSFANMFSTPIDVTGSLGQGLCSTIREMSLNKSLSQMTTIYKALKERIDTPAAESEGTTAREMGILRTRQVVERDEP